MTGVGSSAVLAQMSAIARRDFIVQLAYPIQLAMRFSQVVFSCAVLYFVAKLVQNPEALKAYEGDYFAFAITGTLVTSFASLGVGTFSASITSEQSTGSLEALLVTPTRLPTLLAGAFVVPLALTIANVVFYLGTGAVFGMRFSLIGLVTGLPALALLMLNFCSFGILSAAVIMLTKRGEPFTGLAAQLTSLLAGSLFPVAVLPEVLQPLSRLVPAFWGLEALRGVLLRHEGFLDTIPNLVVMGAFAAVLLPAALWCFDRAVGMARVTGTLGNY